MKAKTKLQKEVLKLSKKLPRVSAAQRKWALKNALVKYGYFGKKEAVCFECGHKWQHNENLLLVKTDGAICPNCGNKLTARENKRLFTETVYFSIVTVCKGFQLMRFFSVKGVYRQGYEADIFMREVCQNWMNSKGESTIIALAVNNMSFYWDQWVFGSSFEIRNYHQRHDINPAAIYPRMKYLDIIKRNGFSGDFYDISPLRLFRGILTDSKAETLIKAKQINMLGKYLYHGSIDSYWPSIKICIRNNYLIEDAQTWCDHIKILKRFKKDINNAIYVCPKDLHTEHQQYIEREKIISEREYIKRQKEQLEEQKRKKELRLKKLRADQKQYLKDKAKFMGLKLSDGSIEIELLKSVSEFKNEGTELNHCVFKNEYYNEKDSLILSAKKEAKRLETIQFSLSQMQIIQARGYNNLPTEYHDQIVNLVNRNIGTIQKLCS